MDLAYAFSPPVIYASIKRSPEDFIVRERLGFELSGQGEHVYLFIAKRMLNTEDVARQIARLVNTHVKNVSYAGLKDKHALTYQWFSVSVPIKANFNWQALDCDQLTVLASQRHSRKLRRGAIVHNDFEIRLSHFRGDLADLLARVRKVQDHGVPNYFGEQRFGINGANLQAALHMFNGDIKPSRHLRSMYLSAARAHLFNRLLSQRVTDGTWDTLLPGEACVLDSTHSFFVADILDSELQQRCTQCDIHPSGPLWGRGDLPSRQEAGQIESECLSADSLTVFRNGLEAFEMQQQRRTLRVMPGELTLTQQDQEIVLQFTLPSGCYATAVLRELVKYD